MEYKAYGKVAVLAAAKAASSKITPSEAWESVAQEIFSGKKASIQKGCPKAAFLGLCNEGYVKGIKKHNYIRSGKNKDYAIAAIELLRKGKGSLEPYALWKEVLSKVCPSETDKAYNSQMDVVLALWNEKLIAD